MATEIYVDGSADNFKKEAPSYTAVLLPGEKVRIAECEATTNNEAEYQAVREGIRWAACMGMKGKVVIVSDSQLVVNQLKGDYRTREHRLHVLCNETLEEAHSKEGLKFVYRWCRREENQAGIELENYLKREKAAC